MARKVADAFTPESSARHGMVPASTGARVSSTPGAVSGSWRATRSRFWPVRSPRKPRRRNVERPLGEQNSTTPEAFSRSMPSPTRGAPLRESLRTAKSGHVPWFAMRSRSAADSR